MRVLWDFRLFSFGYADRGVGVYATAVASTMLDAFPALEMVVWGDKDKVPLRLHRKNITWVSYVRGSWKSSIAVIPWLVLRHNIDIVHYWIALGPLYRIGLTPFTLCPSVATIYDTGVEKWDMPYMKHVRSTVYWRAQKMMLRYVNAIMTISQSALSDIKKTFNVPDTKPTGVIYPVLYGKTIKPARAIREKYFITLGGSLHKNCRRVVDAFTIIKKKYPDYRMVICGTLNRVEEKVETFPDGVIHEPGMERYARHLNECSGLIIGSIAEGLGLPAIEAMHYGCPLVLSSIPVFHELCADAAVFVDPFDTRSVANGIEQVLCSTMTFAMKSKQAAETYSLLCSDTAKKCFQLYESVVKTEEKID